MKDKVNLETDNNHDISIKDRLVKVIAIDKSKEQLSNNYWRLYKSNKISDNNVKNEKGINIVNIVNDENQGFYELEDIPHRKKRKGEESQSNSNKRPLIERNNDIVPAETSNHSKPIGKVVISSIEMTMENNDMVLRK